MGLDMYVYHNITNFSDSSPLGAANQQFAAVNKLYTDHIHS